MKRQRLNRHMLFPMLTVIMLLSASHICAQRNFSLFGKGVSVGVRAGITYSEISKSNYSDGKIGWLIGADLEIPVEKVSENFFIRKHSKKCTFYTLRFGCIHCRKAT